MSATEKQPEVADTSSLSPEARAGDQVQRQTAEETLKEDGVSEVSQDCSCCWVEGMGGPGHSKIHK